MCSFLCVSACDKIRSACVVGHDAVVGMGNPRMQELHVVDKSVTGSSCVKRVAMWAHNVEGCRSYSS